MKKTRDSVKKAKEIFDLNIKFFKKKGTILTPSELHTLACTAEIIDRMLDK